MTRTPSIAIVVAVLLLALPGDARQEDQRSRQASKDPRGLLGIDEGSYDLSASTGGDFYDWAAGELRTAALTIPTGGEAVLLAYGPGDGSRTTFEVGPDGGYHARCVVPSSPFRVAVSGRDAGGAPFRRVEPGLRAPD